MQALQLLVSRMHEEERARYVRIVGLDGLLSPVRSASVWRASQSPSPTETLR